MLDIFLSKLSLILLPPVIIGGIVISRILIEFIFKKELKRCEKGLVDIQTAYNGMVWNERHYEKAYFTAPNLGQFFWGEFRFLLRIAKWTFIRLGVGGRDRQAVECFLKYESIFASQPNHLELHEGEILKSYKKYIIHHLWCMDFMRNVAIFGSNNSKEASTYYKDSFILDKTEAFEQYAKDNGIRIVNEGMETETDRLLFKELLKKNGLDTDET
jgi:hypothetical protein